MSGISPSADASEKYKMVKTGQSNFGVFCINDAQDSVECFYKDTKDESESKKVAGGLSDDDVKKFKEDKWPALEKYAEENLGAKAAYIIAEFLHNSSDGRACSKLVLISWCPENKLKVKAKMLHGSTLNAIKSSFDGLQGKAIQASSFGDLSYESILGDL